MQSMQAPALLIRRVFAAPPQRVYEAWTNPELAQQFLCPGSVQISEITMDVRTGGNYRIGMRREDGDVWYVRGTYRDVVPNTRLSMTWVWEEDAPQNEQETLLTVELAPHANGTELTLRHERFATTESRDNHEHGWTTVLDNFEGLK